MEFTSEKTENFVNKHSKKAKWILGLISLWILLAWLFEFKMVEPGFEAAATTKWGTGKGIQESSYRTGMVPYMPMFTMLTEYPNTIRAWEPKKTVDVTFGKLVVHCHPRLNIRIVPGQSPKVFDKYKTNLEAILDGPLTTYMLEAARASGKGWSIDSAQANRALFDLAFKEVLIKLLKHDGPVWEVDQFTVNPDWPEEVQGAILRETTAVSNARAARAEAEGEKATAEKNKAKAEAAAATKIAEAKGEAESLIAKAKGEAEANKTRSASITPTILRMKELENEKAFYDKWDGSVPSTVISGGGAGKNFLFDLKPKQ